VAQKTRGGGALAWQWWCILCKVAETSCGCMVATMDMGGMGTMGEEATNMDFAAAPAA